MRSKQTARLYRFEPVPFDLFFPTKGAPAAGAIVVKVQPFGCPKNGTMGNCYVAPPDDLRDVSMVMVNSLVPLKTTVKS